MSIQYKGAKPRAGLALLALGAVLVWPGAVLAGDVIVLTLDGVQVAQCGQTWTEAGVTLGIVPTTAEDCGAGSCFFGLAPQLVWLYPARLEGVLGLLSGEIASMDVDIVDNCGAGCTRIFLYEGATTVASASNTAVGGQTLHLAAGSAAVDRIAVSSCEGNVSEIRLVTSAVPLLPQTWTRVKVLYE